MNTRLNEMLGKELSRRDFLKMVAGAILMVVGFEGMYRYLSRYNPGTKSTPTNTTHHGFGSQRFGR